MIKCIDKTYYTSGTNNLKDRIKRHNNNNNKEIHYTSSRLPVVLETYVAFSDKYKASKFERYLKSGSGKAFMNKRLVERG